jgi:tetratricopeptide (TPR) repeat protein
MSPFLPSSLRIGSSVLFCILCFACQSPRDKAYTKIAENEKLLHSDSTMVVNSRLANDLVVSYISFAEQFPSDTLSPEYLFRAAEVSSGIGNPVKAIELYKQVYEKYPSYKRSSYSLFLQGFVYENQLRDTANARKIYSLFIEKYPSHPLARDVKFSIDNLGKSEEELIREFEANLTKSSQ